MREAKRLRKRYASFDDDFETLVSDITDNPMLGVDLGNGIRKIRMRIRSKARGKSGGARVITFNVIVAADEKEVDLIFLYDKSERSSISIEEIDEYLKLNGLK